LAQISRGGVGWNLFRPYCIRSSPSTGLVLYHEGREEHEEIVGWTERSEFHHFEMLNMKDRTSENGTKQQKSSISYPYSSVFNVFAFSPYHRRVLLQLAQQFFFRLEKSCHDDWSGTTSLLVQASLIDTAAKKTAIYTLSDTARERDRPTQAALLRVIRKDLRLSPLSQQHASSSSRRYSGRGQGEGNKFL
jgi:hypothetical protein